ncbi:MAG TPA: hypothetical protein VMT16_07245, partial [Thermoanaerobaculia bacterium]|nr:hypothetical protein [Thermoanaerobaculia bacterium]
HHLRIAATWDGRPVAASEVVTLTLKPLRRGLRLRVEAPFHGDPPPAGPPGATDRLWEREVVELFLVGAGEPVPYTEVELGPHGHHLVLRLAGVRQVVASRLPLRYRAAIAGGRWAGEALLPRDLLPPPPHRVNAFAIHGSGEARRFLAMAPVPGPRPDFHQLARFPVLDLS